MFDAQKRLILCNPGYAGLYRLPSTLTVRGTPLADILAYRRSIGSAPLDMTSYFDVVSEAEESGSFAGIRVVLEDGRTIQITHNPMRDGGYVATHEDVTAHTEAEARIRYLASHDALTGLPNRLSFAERLEQAQKQIRRNEKLAIHCLDLDQFKVVNDTLGHHTGDRLLQAVTERFKGCIRDTDTVARLGGDEFAILQVGIQDPEQASRLAGRLIEEVGRPFEIDGDRLAIGLSVGIAVFPGDGLSAEKLLRNADIALYRSKVDGRNAFRFFEQAMDAPLQARRRLELDLRAALAQASFHLHYQPLVDAATNGIIGFEALLRWDHPERGAVPPLDFIPLCEATGLIVPLGEWVLNQACADAARWPAPIRVAVNLSPMQFRSGKLADEVRRALAVSGLDPSRLELEITETVLLAENDRTLRTLHDLKALGVRIALDDFGTGYSSLSYLRSFPFDKIKMDKSFVSGSREGNDCEAIIKAVAGLGAALRMVTTAEGVETAAQLERMRAFGFGEIQGYHCGRPQPADAVAVLLRLAAAA